MSNDADFEMKVMKLLKVGIFLIPGLLIVGTPFAFASEKADNLTLWWDSYRQQKAYIYLHGQLFTLDQMLVQPTRTPVENRTFPPLANGYDDPDLCDTCWMTQDATHYDYYYYKYRCWGISTDGSYSHDWREFLFWHSNTDPVCDHLDYDMGDNTCPRHRD